MRFFFVKHYSMKSALLLLPPRIKGEDLPRGSLERKRKPSALRQGNVPPKLSNETSGRLLRVVFDKLEDSLVSLSGLIVGTENHRNPQPIYKP